MPALLLSTCKNSTKRPPPLDLKSKAGFTNRKGHKMNAPNSKTGSISIALLLLLPMIGCVSQPPIGASACPSLPSKPAARQQTPPQTYSENAAQRIDKWQQRLTDTLQTSDSAKLPGPSD